MALDKRKFTLSLPYTILGLIMLCMVLTGCKLHEPTRVSENRIQVEETEFSDRVRVSDLNEVALEGLAYHYRKHGDGPVMLTVAYDPKSKTGNAMHASDAAARLAKEMRKAGISHVEAGILPVNGQGGHMDALISYTAYNALAPKDCYTMPGYGVSTVEADDDYRLGCTFDTVFARQIARPKDLKGQGVVDMTTDGRRSANTVELYRTGIPNERLDGESASAE
ncbi:MAG: CpaD family pilus assembly lipoprotein [Alphaproteobacteria bacterium]